MWYVDDLTVTWRTGGGDLSWWPCLFRHGTACAAPAVVHAVRCRAYMTWRRGDVLLTALPNNVVIDNWQYMTYYDNDIDIIVHLLNDLMTMMMMTVIMINGCRLFLLYIERTSWTYRYTTMMFCSILNDIVTRDVTYRPYIVPYVHRAAILLYSTMPCRLVLLIFMYIIYWCWRHLFLMVFVYVDDDDIFCTSFLPAFSSSYLLLQPEWHFCGFLAFCYWRTLVQTLHLTSFLCTLCIFVQ